MADVGGLPDEPVFFEVPPEALAMANPFGDQDSAVAELPEDVEINVAQLADELSRGMGTEVRAALVKSPGGARLYVTPPVPGHVLEEVGNWHVPDELYGLQTAQRERVELVARLRRGDVLTSEELHRALLLVLSER